MMRSQDVDLSPIEASIEVEAPLLEAFDLFTTGMGSWWPMASHSIGEGRVTDVGFEGYVGGRIFEIWDDGTEKDWGVVLEWEPPKRVVFSWHPSLEPGTPTQVEVRFSGAGPSTRVDLIHRGWEQVEENRRVVRDSYVPGWTFVLDAFRGAWKQ